jgi:hypothetical protein
VIGYDSYIGSIIEHGLALGVRKILPADRGPSDSHGLHPSLQVNLFLGRERPE